MSVDRLDDRKHLLAALDQIPRAVDASGAFDSLNRFDRQAFEFVSGQQARDAFDLSKEDESLREQYGRHIGDKALCWPGDWSKREPPL